MSVHLNQTHKEVCDGSDTTNNGYDYDNMKTHENEIDEKFQTKVPSYWLERKIYPCLSIAFKKTCKLIIKKGLIYRSKQIFNAIDYIAEVLWNLNPLHPERSSNNNKWQPLYFIFQNRKFMVERPIYPRYYELTENEAATIIQALVKGWLTRRNFKKSLK